MTDDALVPAAPASLINVIAAAAADPNTDVAKLTALIALQRDQIAEAARIAFVRDMAAAQAKMVPVVRGAENTHTNSKYARLEDVDRAIRPIITEYGFSATFANPEEADDGIVITCDLAHREGHIRHYRLAGRLDGVGAQGKANKTPIQALGSTVSYLRRYLKLMIFDLALTNEDNDGNAVNPISAHQLREIENALEQTGSDRAKFLAFMKVNDLADLNVTDYQKAMAALSQKARRGGA